MAAVSQRIPNYLGGISQQTDDMKFPGQLRSCLNGYPDPTFGMIKRPGGKFLAELKDNSGTVITPNTYDNGKWFTIFRDSTEQYLCVIKGADIDIWKLEANGATWKTVTVNDSGYLTSGSPTKDDFDILTINDVTFITNKKVVVTTVAAPSYTFGKRATIQLQEVEYGAKYEVKLDATTVSYTTFDAEAAITTPAQSEKTVTADAIINALVTAINGVSGFTATRIGTNIEVEKSTAFTISVKGGQDGKAILAFQDAIDNISKLPSQSKHGRIVEVTNTSANEDNYYVTFVADNGVSGVGYWEETIKPNISTGLTETTMPHVLVRESNGSFTFDKAGTSPYKWEPRLVGDDQSNPHPSFVGNTIQQLFFYNNRLGILCEESVITSQSGDFFNFYSNSALTSIASDPVDISCSSIRPATLHGVLPVAQGLVLFSRSQQFLLQSDQGILTPTNVLIKTISNYEMDTVLDPVDLGTTIAFISKTPSYTRVFEMMTRGQDESPYVTDITKIIPELIPSTIDQVVSSPQNSLLSLAASASRDVYLFKFYTNGNERIVESWIQWKVLGNLLHQAIDRDIFWTVTKQASAIVVQRVSLIQSPASSTFLTSDGSKVDPRLDMWATPASKVFNNVAGDKYTKVYLPFKHDSNRTLCVVTTNPGQTTPIYANSGLVLFPTVLQDGTGWYAKVLELDLSNEDLVVGYTYSLDIELPQTFYRQGDNQQVTDYTASLIVSRMKFKFGLGGDVVFKLKAKGRNEWVETQAVKQADYYLANDIPFVNTSQFNVPIYQRSENVNVRLFSDTPFPVTLVSMNWEGQYSPRYYARR